MILFHTFSVFDLFWGEGWLEASIWVLISMNAFLISTTPNQCFFICPYSCLILSCSCCKNAFTSCITLKNLNIFKALFWFPSTFYFLRTESPPTTFFFFWWLSFMVGVFSLCDFDFSYIRGCRAFLLCVQTSVSNPGSFHQFCVAALFSSSDLGKCLILATPWAWGGMEPGLLPWLGVWPCMGFRHLLF